MIKYCFFGIYYCISIIYLYLSEIFLTMEKLSVLRSWTKVLFVLSIIIMFFVPGVILVALVRPELVPFDFTVNGDKEFTISTAIVCLINVAGFALYLYSLYLFRKILHLFSKRRIFDNEVIVNFRKIGLYMWYGLFITTLPGPIYRLFTQKPITINLDFDVVSYILFTGSLALFFTVLSEVFQMAKNIKEENDLTI